MPVVIFKLTHDFSAISFFDLDMIVQIEVALSTCAQCTIAELDLSAANIELLMGQLKYKIRKNLL